MYNSDVENEEIFRHRVYVFYFIFQQKIKFPTFGVLLKNYGTLIIRII